MRRPGILLACLIGLVLVLAAHPRDAKAYYTVGSDLFYDELAPYGDWFQMEDYGWVWTPRRVAADWRPYTRGRWVFADDDGWMWASDEEFGWATDHYGRWFFDDRYGWVWVPGNEWAPAWVSWRSGGGYVGWAPLPPRFRWNEGVGFRVGDVDFDSYIAPRQYVFVPERHFVDAGVYRQVVPPARNVTIVNATRNVTNYGVRQNRPVNRSLSLEQVEARVGHAVPRVRVVEDQAAPPRRAEVSGGAVKVFRPAVKTDSAARPRSLLLADVPKVKAHPAEPPVDAKQARRPERPPTAAPRPGPTQPQAHANVKPAPTDAARRHDESLAAQLQREAAQAEQRRQAAQNAQAVQRQEAERKMQQDRQRQEQQARLRKEQLEQTQERQQQALRTRQSQQEQQLQQRQQQQQEREASQRQGQRQAELQRQQEEQRLKLQQEHERDHQALQDKQARQQQQLQEKQKKEQVQAEQSKQKQQQREEAKKPKARPQPTPPPS